MIRSDIYLEAMKEMGVTVKVAEEQKITLFDGVFDGKDPEKYARSFAINSMLVAVSGVTVSRRLEPALTGDSLWRSESCT